MESVIATKFRNWLNSDQRFKKALVSLDYYLRRRKVWSTVEGRTAKERFAAIYRHNLWNSEESRSGGGSTLRRTQNLRTHLPRVIERYGITSVLDAGCGDFNWMKAVRPSLPVRYIGADLVADLVAANQRQYSDDRTTFIELDITTDDLPQADLIICRECLFHLPNGEIVHALRRFRNSGSKYLLTTHYPSQTSNVDISSTGFCRAINFELAPFCFPAPKEQFDEDTPGQYMALWALTDITSTSHVDLANDR